MCIRDSSKTDASDVDAIGSSYLNLPACAAPRMAFGKSATISAVVVACSKAGVARVGLKGGGG
eukprot:2325823-Prymnesium_polylepis.1